MLPIANILSIKISKEQREREYVLLSSGLLQTYQYHYYQKKLDNSDGPQLLCAVAKCKENEKGIMSPEPVSISKLLK